MKIAVWGTKHEIAKTVADAVLEGFETIKVPVDIFLDTDEVFYDADVHIGYGILRGMDGIFREAQKRGQKFFLIDRGYWKPGHYDGYYRISLNGTQQTTGLDKLEPDYERWDKLGLEILPAIERSGEILVCPQTEAVGKFTGEWIKEGLEFGQHPIVRLKGSQVSLQDDLDKCRKVVTFNSSVGWEALRQGIPCESDSCFSFVGAYKKYFDHGNFMDVDSRRRMMAVQASLQLTLDEVRQGLLWPLIQKLVTSTSGTMIEKKSAAM